MKYIMLLFVVINLSCALSYEGENYDESWWYIEGTPEIELSGSDNKKINTIINWVDDNTAYYGKLDTNGFREPQKILDDRIADCEDRAILSVSLIKTILDLECDIIIVKNKIGYHALVVHDGIVFNSGGYDIYLYTYKFNKLGNYIGEEIRY